MKKILLLSVLLGTLLTLIMSPVQAASQWPADPSSNAPQRALWACSDSPKITKKCKRVFLKAVNKARSREGVRAMKLPKNFSKLSTVNKVFVLTNLDRVDRGLSPIRGVEASMSSLAMRGANAQGDPWGPSGYSWASNWAGTANPMWNEYLWVYSDGPGGGNLECRKNGDPGCWGHRHNILYKWGTKNLIMGVGVNSSKHSTAQLIVAKDKKDHRFTFTWKQEKRFLPKR